MNIAHPSLQRRLLALVLAIVACVWLGAAISTWLDVRHELDELLDGHLAQAAAILVVQQSDEMDAEEHGVDAPSLHPYAPKVVFQVLRGGRLAMHSANAPQRPLGGEGDAFRPGFATVTIDGTSWRVFSTQGAQPDVHIHVGEEVTSRDHILLAVLRSTLLPLALALPVLAVALWWAIRRGLSPLRQLGHVLRARQPNALDPLDLPGAHAEVMPMVEALNHLFHRIGKLLESERRFTADASHELRTPIAAIRAQAQVALAESNDTLRRQALGKTLEGCDRAARLVDQLLTLSRLDASASPAVEDMDLCVVARQVLADIAPGALAKQQTVELAADTPCPAQGNPTLLAILVRNLVDNAIRYSPGGAHIRISVGQKAGHTTLTVEDSGPGVSDPDLARLGERFFRVTGNLESGSGLGWSIVRRIVDVHHLQVHVGRSSTLGGLAVTITT